MKKFEITEEQIKELAKGNKKVERMFPEIFETKLEIGKWYISKDLNKHIFCVTKTTKDRYYYYGFNSAGHWVKNDYYYFNDLGLKHGFRLATEKEVKGALIKEAKIRGFKFNLEFKPIEHERNGSAFKKSAKIGSMWDFSENTLFSTGYGVWTVFKDGVWAEVFKTKYLTKKQAEEKLTELSNDGYEYQITD